MRISFCKQILCVVVLLISFEKVVFSIESPNAVDSAVARFYSFDSKVFVASSLLNLTSETQAKLSPKVPAIKELGMMIGRQPGLTADLYIFNFLLNFFMGFPLHDEAHTLARISGLPIGEIELITEFTESPKIHQELLLWMRSQTDRSIMPDRLLARLY